MCCSVNGSVVLCVAVCELFGETLTICYGIVYCGRRCFVGYTIYGLPKNVRVVSVIPVFI